jgi:hypothetical protein
VSSSSSSSSGSSSLEGDVESEVAETLSDVPVLVVVLTSMFVSSEEEESSKLDVAVKLYCDESLRSVSNAPRSEKPLVGSSSASSWEVDKCNHDETSDWTELIHKTVARATMDKNL